MARHVLPWVISAGLLYYVFGDTDWNEIRAATDKANLPLFTLITTIDRMAFFLIWTLLQAMALRRFVAQVPIRSVVAIRGGSELLRAVSNPLSDGAFFLGLAQLTRGKLEAVLAAALVPGVCHFLILVLQITIALPFLDWSPAAGNGYVAVWCAGLWGLVLVVGIGVRLSRDRNIPGADWIRRWLEHFPLRELRPFFLWFIVLATIDVIVQGLATRAFGVPLPWTELMAKIPLLYFALVIPSFGNFGVREATWEFLFHQSASGEALEAFALGTNLIFAAINILLGLIFLSKALQLVAEVRRASREGEKLPEPLIHNPGDT